MAKCRHAPAFLATLVKYPSHPLRADRVSGLESGEAMESPIRLHTLGKAAAWSYSVSDSMSSITEEPVDTIDANTQSDRISERKPFFIVPLAAVLFSASFGLLSFLSHSQGSNAQLVSNRILSCCETLTNLLGRYSRNCARQLARDRCSLGQPLYSHI